jgi:receptor-type tyrosine-protein phosphatase beta
LFNTFFFIDDIPTVRITNEWRMALRNLYPGAAYQLKVFAISHGLLSEPHDYFQAVCKLKI